MFLLNPFYILFDAIENFFISRFQLTIGLWRRHKTKPNLNVEFFEIFHDVFDDEFLSIIFDDDSGYTVPCYDVSPYELANLFISDSAKGFYFYIPEEIINSYNNELFLSLSWWKCIKRYNPLLSNGKTTCMVVR